MRSRPSLMPASSLASGLMRPWVVVHGWVMVERTSPRLAVISGALLFHFIAQIQHQLPSRYRVGSGSVITAVGRIILMPLIFIFGIISNQNVFAAGWMLVVLSGMAVFVQLQLDE